MTENAEGASTFLDWSAKASASFAVMQQILCDYIPEFDGIRALAVISVVWHNVTAGQYTGSAMLKIINMFANTGWVGVQLFFVLSGFLITGILLDEKKTPRQLRNFYMRRFLRIFPLYYAVLCVAFVILPMLNAVPQWLEDDRVHQVWYWTFLVNWSAPFLGDGGDFGHFWSLAVEEQFYLLWPLCVIKLQRRTLIWICWGLMVSALLIRGALTIYDPALAIGAAYKFTVARWDALAVGALLALSLRDQGWYSRAVKAMPVIFVSALIYIVIFMVVDRNFEPIGPGVAVFNQTAVALLFGVLVFAAICTDKNRSTSWQRLLAYSPLRSVGKYSYAIYVFHLPMRQIVEPFWRDYFSRQVPIMGATSFALLVFVASYAAAFCSWACLEKPCLRMKRFFSMHKYVAA